MSVAPRHHSDSIELKWHDLCWSAERSVRYHEKREAFFTRLNTTSTAISLIFGTSAFATLMSGSKIWAAFFALIVAIAGLVNLVAKSTEMARRHEGLRKRWIGLERRLQASEITQENWQSIRAERLDLEADEPPVRGIVDAICHNELLVARGYAPTTHAESFCKIGPIVRATANFIDWNPMALPTLADVESTRRSRKQQSGRP